MNFHNIQIDPAQFAYGIAAVGGGVARYLNSFANGAKFSLGVFFASAFVAGFSGYMFALIGISLNLPLPMQFIMAGTGGFFGEQTMKFIMEYITKKIK